MRHHSRSAFTLLELLVVVAILAITAGVVMVSFTSGDGMDADVRGPIALDNMRTIRGVLMKFRQDTLLLPKESLLDDSQLNPTPNAIWFDHPANFDQLFNPPVDKNISGRWVSSPGKSRAWRGPYCDSRKILKLAIPSVAADLAKVDALTLSGTAAALKPAFDLPVILDPWGRPYLYIVPGGNNFSAAYLQCYGADGILNTDDDIKLDVLK